MKPALTSLAGVLGPSAAGDLSQQVRSDCACDSPRWNGCAAVPAEPASRTIRRARGGAAVLGTSAGPSVTDGPPSAVRPPTSGVEGPSSPMSLTPGTV